METLQPIPNPNANVAIALADSTVRSCSLDENQLDVTLTNSLRLQFLPSNPDVKRYLAVVENRHLANVPGDFVDQVERFLRDGKLGVPKLVDFAEPSQSR